MLSTKQLEYLAACNHRWNFKIGATGSGKSWLDYAVVIPKRLLALRGEGAAVLLGHTQGTLSRNILDPMREIWGEALVSTISSDNTARLFGRKVYVLGADKKNQVARIQGMTIEYAYGDEVTTWNEDLFQMLKTRLRCAHSHFDGTANPADPHHWLKKFIDSGADILCQTSTIDDNPALDPTFVTQLKQELAGTVYYNRFILGQWCAAEGIIYRIFADSQAARDGRFLWPAGKKLPTGTRVQIGVDFGGNGSQHAFVAVGILPAAAGVVALCSDRVDPKGTDTAFLAGKFLDFVRQVFAGWGEIHAVYCDSAEQVLIEQQVLPVDLTPYADVLGLKPKDEDVFDYFRTKDLESLPGDVSFEPDAATCLFELMKAYLRNTYYYALIDSAAAEQGARRSAMKSATDNANEMVETLTRLYNRVRQGAITTEITEIVGGAAALED